MKIGIFGSGAVGISIAAHIYDYDPNIIYLCARDRHYESLNNGVTYNGKHYDINMTQEMAMDYLIVCVKNYDLESSLDDMKYFISDKTGYNCRIYRIGAIEGTRRVYRLRR